MSAAALPRCLNCAHWIQSEAPAWAQSMGMAVCAKKLTKAVTLANWISCGKHERARPEQVKQRVVWLRSVGAVRAPVAARGAAVLDSRLGVLDSGSGDFLGVK